VTWIHSVRMMDVYRKWKKMICSDLLQQPSRMTIGGSSVLFRSSKRFLRIGFDIRLFYR
jgi:hypothetical protein